jgi:hypothetical protein
LGVGVRGLTNEKATLAAARRVKNEKLYIAKLHGEIGDKEEQFFWFSLVNGKRSHAILLHLGP